MENNVSVADIEHLERLWHQEFTRHLFPSLVHLFLCLVAGVSGNIFVFVVYQVKLKTTENRLFIPYLAGVDFSACVVTTVFFILDVTHYVNFPSQVLCKVFYFFTYFVVAASLLLQLAIALSRYIKICHSKRNFNFQRFEKMAIIGIFLGSAIFATPSVFFADVKEFDVTFNQYNVTGRTCKSLAGNHPIQEIVRMILISAIVTGIIISCCVMYAKVGIVIYKTFPGKQQRVENNKRQCIDLDFGSIESHNFHLNGKSRKISASNLSIHTSDTMVTNAERKLRHHHKRRMNFSVMFILMFIVYIVAWIPYITIMIFSVFHDDLWTRKSFHGVDINIYMIARNAFITAYCANPIIYTFFDSKFRLVVQKSMCKSRCF